jgi:hypothetical protein
VDEWREQCRHALSRRNTLNKLDKCLQLLVSSVAAALEGLRQLLVSEELPVPQTVAAAANVCAGAAAAMTGKSHGRGANGARGGRAAGKRGRGGGGQREASKRQRTAAGRRGRGGGGEDMSDEEEGFEEEQDDTLYCICLQAHNQDTYISCDTCGDWYHLKCVGLSATQAKGIKRWVCPVCCALRGDDEPLRAASERLKRTARLGVGDVDGLLEAASKLPVQLPEEQVLAAVLQHFLVWQVRGSGSECSRAMAGGLQVL